MLRKIFMYVFAKRKMLTLRYVRVENTHNLSCGEFGADR